MVATDWSYFFAHFQTQNSAEREIEIKRSLIINKGSTDPNRSVSKEKGNLGPACLGLGPRKFSKSRTNSDQDRISSKVGRIWNGISRFQNSRTNSDQTSF